MNPSLGRTFVSLDSITYRWCAGRTEDLRGFRMLY